MDKQAKGLADDKKNLLEDVDALRQCVGRRNSALKKSRKELRKTTMKLELTEERCFQMGYDEVVLKVHAQGWDHKAILDDDMDDPVGREAVDGPLVVSSCPDDEELSE